MTERWLMVGCGITADSVIEFAKSRSVSVAIWDPSNQLTQQQADSRWAGVTVVAPALDQYDYSRVIVSPGISPRQSCMSHLDRYQQQLGTDIDCYLAYRNSKSPRLIVVTGSNGKSTVCHMLAHILNCSGRQAIVLGNAGVPLLTAYRKAQQHVTDIVCELSSFQLYWSGVISADLAVIVNIQPNHLDWHGQMKDYVAAKAKILTQARHVVIEREALATIAPGFSVESAYDVVDGDEVVPGIGKIASHNRAIAVACAVNLGCQRDQAQAWLRSYRGLPYRLQRIDGLAWPVYNDAKSTTLDAACAAIIDVATVHQSAVVWLAGGRLKMAMEIELWQKIDTRVSIVFAYGEDAAQWRLFAQQVGIPCRVMVTVAEALNEIVKQGWMSRPLVFSPAATSFDQFCDYQQRGAQFEQLVMEIANKSW